jgi:hypothetical protein
MNKMNILTHAQNHTANFAKTSETTPKEQISPAEVTKKTKFGSMSNLTQTQSLVTAVSQIKSSESNKDVKEVQINKTVQPQSKLGLTKLPSSVSASAFTPVFKHNQNQAANNALTNFWQMQQEASSNQISESSKQNHEA